MSSVEWWIFIFFFLYFTLLDFGDGYFVNAIINIVLNAVMVVITILLLVTAFQNEKPDCLLPWLIMEFMWLIFVICSYLYIGIYIILTGATMKAIPFLVFPLICGGRLL